MTDLYTLLASELGSNDPEQPRPTTALTATIETIDEDRVNSLHASLPIA